MLLESYMEEAARTAEERKLKLADKIRQARIEMGWKQRELARAVNVDSMTVSRWDRAQHAPDMDMLFLIAAATRKPLWFFLLDDEPMDAAESAVRLKAVETRISDLEEKIDRLADELTVRLLEAGDQDTK